VFGTECSGLGCADLAAGLLLQAARAAGLNPEFRSGYSSVLRLTEPSCC
jgi:hypothetical protein